MRCTIALGAALLLSVTVRAADISCEAFEGGIIRGPQSEKKIALEFSADQYVEGASTILDELASHHAKASFFLTGRCVTSGENCKIVRRMIADGHYVGPHSNTHPLLCPWTGKKRCLVTKEFFADDLKQNISALEKCGLKRDQIKYFLPPYEWYNAEVAGWTREAGLRLINHSSGTRSAADYTEEHARNFVPSQVIFDSIIHEEQKNGLNGHLLLMHLGAGPERKDKMHRRLGELLDVLQKRGYQFVRVDDLLRDCAMTGDAWSGDKFRDARKTSKAEPIFLPVLISANN
jgi:peptidoglycan/xylan/chitin deacetylase (PgdA/CDA1 family)